MIHRKFSPKYIGIGVIIHIEMQKLFGDSEGSTRIIKSFRNQLFLKQKNVMLKFGFENLQNKIVISKKIKLIILL